MKNVTAGRLGGFMEETEKCCHAELVSASSVSESKFRWTLNQVQGDGVAASTGFTLIELLVVVLIIGILAAIALPQYQQAVYKTKFVQVMPFVKALAEAQDAYYLANGAYSHDLTELDITIPSSYTYRRTYTENNYSYDLLDSKDAYIQIYPGYGGIMAYIKNCPAKSKAGPYCAYYNYPFNHAYDVIGKKPNCSPYDAGGEKVKAFGEKVCLSLGGKKETTPWGDKYYL